MKRIYFQLGLFLCAALLVGAQEPGPPPPGGHGFGGPGGGFGPGMHAAKTVTGEPYSADATTTIDQKFADGNGIHRVIQASVARDSSGRTYSKETMTGGPFGQSGNRTIVFVTDPVAGYSYMIDQTKKTVMRRALRRRPVGEAGHPRGPRPDSASRVEKDLGSQTVGGVEATGKSFTHTIAAGEVGNSQAITETTEVWTSPDLQIVVLSKRTDPRMGTSTYALNNIQRNEPDASLFQVPSGYTVEDAPRPPAQ